MSYHPRHAKLARLSAQFEGLFAKVSECDTLESLPQDLADEIAATAGDVMIELADQRDDVLARTVIDDARRLRELVRALSTVAVKVSAAGHSLVRDLGLVIH
jgi:hypothetical protein